MPVDGLDNAWRARGPFQSLAVYIAGKLFENQLLPHMIQARRIKTNKLY